MASPTPNAILSKMLERLFGALLSGPALNCRPHSSRQRIDVTQLGRMLDVSPEELLRQLLGEGRHARITGKAAKPKRTGPQDPQIELSEEERRAARQWSDQQTLVGKLRTIAEDARTYEQDTGVHVLNIGFPLLSMPPGAGGKGRGFQSRRVIAPVAFIPVTLEIKSGAAVSAEIACKGEGVDLVRPNIALLAWLEQQTGKRTPELFEDREAQNPWREIHDLVAHVTGALGLKMPELFAADAGLGEGFKLEAAPRAEEESEGGKIIVGAVMGLFPMANEGLLRDTQAMLAGEGELAGPIQSFLQVDVNLGGVVEEHPEELAGGAKEKTCRSFAEERLVAQADPCQSRAALLARKAAGLVIHGPPGTGKSQTITNIIGDHLARGQRVLMVCDKRTALDVVAHRLEYLGFGPLVALVHDPQRDQRDLYRKIRERLEGLADVRTKSAAAREVEKADAELQTLHGDLTAYWKSLMSRGDAGGLTFHDAMGEWLSIREESTPVSPDLLTEVGLDEGRAQERQIRETLERGTNAQYATNPWAGNAAVTLRDFLAKPSEHFRTLLRGCIEAAAKTQIAVDPAIPQLAEGDLAVQAQLRLELADQFEKLHALEQPAILKRWAGADAKAIKKAASSLDGQAAFAQNFRDGPLDQELWQITQDRPLVISTLPTQIGPLNQYLGIARKWYAFICLKQKRLGKGALLLFNLELNAGNAERVRDFLIGLRARLAIRDILAELSKEKKEKELPDDELLESRLSAHSGAVALLQRTRTGDVGHFAALLDQFLGDAARGPAIVEALRKSAAQAEALHALESTLVQTGLFTPQWLTHFGTRARADIATASRETEALAAALPLTLEHMLRIRDNLAAMPGGLAKAVEAALGQSAAADAGTAAIHKGLLAAEISRRLRDDPTLQSMDGQRLKSTFDRYRVLDAQKRMLVREAALHHWVNKQKERLLASTLTRASTLGADMRRRLTMRGERAMRLRQVIEVGREIEGGDPLFDLCPVWMASPETVAQVFPRLPLFDVVIFDEASQCRLEEALPVLMRGKRVVIAGDPKQLPPTRFFETAIIASEDDEVAGEQDLFEKQQGEVEDLLTAALNLTIENAYLDVHYRSRNSDLISFSNMQFYNHRLQAIPGHPANATRFSPLTLYRADGIYEERQNEKEAEQVCRIVRDLLRRAEPPSIGIASFNLVQRDLIIEKLDALALEDADFAHRLAAARTRRGAGSFEGLFVKNLENVQGDERDHIIISTTYGPQKDGKFHQRFGPLGRAGGGRRLNVLITRARAEVHLVTSIPAEIYRALPPVPQGQTPGGAWLLYAYLQFAENLAAAYAMHNGEASDSGPATSPQRPPEVIIHPRPLSLPSRFSESLAQTLADDRRLGSQVHWGNDGFCVDVAIAHPTRPEDVTIGVLCDSNRYLQAPDPVEWDLFRAAVHESQGWKLYRVWTPQFFRDAQEHVDAIAQQVREHLANEQPRDALNVVSNSGVPAAPPESPAQEQPGHS